MTVSAETVVTQLTEGDGLGKATLRRRLRALRDWQGGAVLQETVDRGEHEVIEFKIVQQVFFGALIVRAAFEGNPCVQRCMKEKR